MSQAYAGSRRNMRRRWRELGAFGGVRVVVVVVIAVVGFIVVVVVVVVVVAEEEDVPLLLRYADRACMTERLWTS